MLLINPLNPQPCILILCLPIAKPLVDTEVPAIQTRYCLRQLLTNTLGTNNGHAADYDIWPKPEHLILPGEKGSSDQ